MKLPGYKRITKTDYASDDQETVEKLSFSINDMFQSLTEALNKKLTFRDNMQSTVKAFTVSVNSSGTPINKTAFNLDDSTRIEGLIVVRVQNLDSTNAFPSGGVLISFTQSDKTITVNNITGLVANTNYSINVISIT